MSDDEKIGARTPEARNEGTSKESKMKVRISDSKYGLGEREVSVFRTESPDDVASFAILLIEKWGLVAAIPDGEDSAGRAKLRLPTPDELVERAFAIAQWTYNHARATGHMVPLPDLNEINADFDADRADEKEMTRRQRADRKAAKV